MISQIYGINDDIITHEFIGYICDSLVDEIDFVSVLFSISAFLTDLKRIQTPHSFFGTSEQIKPLQPVGQAAEFKFESKFEPLRSCPAGHLAITPEGYSRRQSKVQWLSSLGRATKVCSPIGRK